MVIFRHFCSENCQFSMHFHDNSKNKNCKNRKIVFSFVSAHCVSFKNVGSKLRAGGLLVVSWDKARYILFHIQRHILFHVQFFIFSFHFAEFWNPTKRNADYSINFFQRKQLSLQTKASVIRVDDIPWGMTGGKTEENFRKEKLSLM